MSVIDLQKKIGVTADGAIGPNTLKAAMKYYKLTPIRAAHFFGQIAHETGYFKLFSENLNYTALQLTKTFPAYFKGDLATKYAKKPIAIASRAYANRMGNGNEASMEGYFYRGRGALQLTGKYNYSLFARYLNDSSIMNKPDLVSTKYAFESAKFFFDNNNLWTICDGGVNDKVIGLITRRVNGGTNGLKERIEYTKKFYGWLTK